jgi:hypothetical protein
MIFLVDSEGHIFDRIIIYALDYLHSVVDEYIGADLLFEDEEISLEEVEELKRMISYVADNLKIDSVIDKELLNK